VIAVLVSLILIGWAIWQSKREAPEMSKMEGELEN
jgi:hypothetical protein